MRSFRWTTTSRVGLMATIAAIAVCLGLLPLAGRSQAVDKKGPEPDKPESKVLTAEDGFNLHASYYKSAGDKESPVVILLHMKDGNRFVWQAEAGFARRLQAEGYAVVAVDLRFHGESKPAGGGAVGGNANQGGGKKKERKKAGLDLKPGVYEEMWRFDLEAVKDFIKDEHQAGNLNMNKVGIVGAEMGASLAAYFAVYDWAKPPYEDGQPGFQTPKGQDVRALVLISPPANFHGLKIAEVTQALKDPAKDIAILVCSGGDAQDKSQSEKIYNMLLQPPAQNEKRMHYKSFSKAKLSGTDLLGQRLGLEETMLVFFGEHLKKIESPWRDRRSKRERLEKKK